MTDEQVVAKFAPWFPHLRSIEPCAGAMPEMTPSEALQVLEDNAQNLYDGGSGNRVAGHAMGVLWALVEKL